MNTTVIPETQLEAQDLDKDDTLFYTLQEVTPVRARSRDPTPALPLGAPHMLPGSQAVAPSP